jgi:hypothetical protein
MHRPRFQTPGSVLVRLLLLAILYAAADPTAANAQSETGIGSSSFTGMSFVCVTYPGGEDIEVTKRNGKTRIMDKDEAKRLVERGHRKVSGQLIRAEARLAKKQEKLEKLLNSPRLALPKVGRQVEELKAEIAELEDEVIPELIGQKSELDQLLTAIPNCGVIPTLSGSNVIQIGTIDLPISGWQGYLISALHVFAVPAGTPDRICASIDGGAHVQVGIRYNACTEFNDGPGTSNPVSVCFNSAIPTGFGALPLGGRANYFHLGSYDDHLAEVQEFLSTSVDLFVPTAERSCPR